VPNDEKDRFGDTMREAERGREDQYFAKRDRELIKKMREQDGTATAPARCPTCGGELREVPRGGREQARCPACQRP